MQVVYPCVCRKKTIFLLLDDNEFAESDLFFRFKQITRVLSGKEGFRLKDHSLPSRK